jgi:hypothetical protein
MIYYWKTCNVYCHQSIRKDIDGFSINSTELLLSLLEQLLGLPDFFYCLRQKTA